MNVHRPHSRLLLAAAVMVATVLGSVLGSGAAPPVGATTTGTFLDVRGCQPDPAVPKRQFRAMWIASVINMDWPSKQGLDVATQKAEYVAWLDLATRLNMNAVIVQVRPTADAFWPSPYEPWSEWLTGQQGADPGYDPLGFLVEEAHKRNLEFHAWFNPFRVSMQNDPSRLVPQHPARQHPDWIYAYGPRLYYNAGILEVRAFILKAMLDAVVKYDIDGVHWDDYFYPYPIPGEDIPDQDTFAKYGGGFDSIHDWRRHNVNRLVEEMGTRLERVKPWVKFGISPYGIWRNRSTDPLGSDTAANVESYDAIYADTRKWVKEEWIDYVVPQIYWNIGLAIADYAKLVPWWSDAVSGTGVHLYIGQAVHKIGSAGAWRDPAELTRHLYFNRNDQQVRGDVHFSAKDVRADRLGGVGRMAADHYSRPALVPVMPQLAGGKPLPPMITRARRTDVGVELTFRRTASGVRPVGEPTSYAVYRFEGNPPVDTCSFADAKHLIASIRSAGSGDQTFTDTTAEPGKTYSYYVSALDRLHHESRPSPPRVVTG